MSKNEKIVTNFNFSFGLLKQLGDSTMLLIDRDTAEFTDRGFTAAKRTEFENFISSIASFSTDEQMGAIQMGATAAKDNERNGLKKQMRSIFLAAKIVFGENGSAYREFGDADITHQTDSDLVRNAKMMVTTATKYLTNLAAEGITEEKILELEETATRFDEAIDFKTQAVQNRDNSTEERITLANKLYALIVKYNDIGKDIWNGVSEAKYNDYVIYNTPTGTPVPETEQTNIAD